LGGAIAPPRRTAVDPPQRVQVFWNVVMLSLAGVTLLAASRTVDQVAIEWGHAVLDAFIISCVAAVSGVTSKLLFRCASARPASLAAVWLLNAGLVAGCGFTFAWYADGFYDEKGVRALAGWGFACSFTWLVIEPLWVLLVVLLVNWVVLPSTEGVDTSGTYEPSSKYEVKGERIDEAAGQLAVTSEAATDDVAQSKATAAVADAESDKLQKDI